MMTRYGSQKHHRRSIRLQGYDYRSPGAYFVTICTRGRECVLDDRIVTGILQDVWQALTRWFPTVVLDEFVVMPNHVHFILWIRPPDEIGAGREGARCGSVEERAGASPAPTGGEGRGPTGGDAVTSVEKAGASPAPTGADGVGATLAVAPNSLVAPNQQAIPDRPISQTEWTIPEPQKVMPNATLGEVVGAYKSLVFKTYLGWVQAHDPMRWAKFWQRNYYEHVIRNEGELKAIRRYIRGNPENWAHDQDNPENIQHLHPPATVEAYVDEALAKRGTG
jgi:putative transposase